MVLTVIQSKEKRGDDSFVDSYEGYVSVTL
jgi:hypothetical protein